MPSYQAPLQDIEFLLNQVFELNALSASLPKLDDLDSDMSHAILSEAAKISEQVLAPLNEVGDEEGCRITGGEVTTARGFIEAYQLFSEGGWGGLGGNPEYEGMGMPKTLVSGIEEMIQGANMALGLAPMLTAGACLAINSHGSEEIKRQYLPKMYSGQWTGAMDLTEAHAGTDLGLMRTKAAVRVDGSYSISGEKIFITWGEHDMAENIVHLVLAKLPDAPAGSRGISLFLVPKFIPNEAGELGVRNALNAGSLESKMGIHGSPTCVMNFDGAQGWLIGELNQGLACMFTMMNYERLVVGIQGIGVAENAYQCAKQYAKERLQGRASGGVKNPELAADPIICHPDVRDMLMQMKSWVESGRAFYIYVAQWLDRAKYTDDAEEKVLAESRIALLTPVVKAFLTDKAFDSCVLGQQVLGGHGYIKEWSQERHVRDVRITQIYEGTNGVQAADLAIRKTVAAEGSHMSSYIQEMRMELELAKRSDVCNDCALLFERSLDQLERTSAAMLARDEPYFANAVATRYLDLVGYVSCGFMWIKQLVAAKKHPEKISLEFYQSKQKTARYYFKKLMPMTLYLAQNIEAGAETVMSLDADQF